MHFGIERISWIFHFVLVFRISSVSHLLETNVIICERLIDRVHAYGSYDHIPSRKMTIFCGRLPLRIEESTRFEVLEEIDRDIKLFFFGSSYSFSLRGHKNGKMATNVN